MATTSLAPGMVSDDELTVERIPMSYDEYLAWYDKDAGRRGGWVDGEVILYQRASEDSDRRLYSRVLPGLWMDAAWLTAATLPPAGKLGTEMALSAG